MKWFRFHAECINNPKIQTLPCETFRAWVNMMCIACHHDGFLPSISELAFHLRVSDDKAVSVINELISLNLLEKQEDRFRMHDWDHWQFRSDVSTGRVRAFRKRFGKHSKKRSMERNFSVSGSGSVSESEKEEKGSDRFESEFWPLAWRKTAKKVARASWDKKAVDDAAMVRIIAGAKRDRPLYMQREIDKRPHMSTWLNQERYDDEPELPFATATGTQSKLDRIMEAI